MLAQITDWCPVLENYDKCCKESNHRACQTTQISQQVHNAVHCTMHLLQVFIKLVRYGQMHIVWEVPQSKWTRSYTKQLMVDLT